MTEEVRRILGELGYDRDDITTEDAMRGDYVVLAVHAGGKTVAVVEVHASGSDLTDDHAAQVKRYAESEGAAHAVLTDGRHWRIYRDGKHAHDVDIDKDGTKGLSALKR